MIYRREEEGTRSIWNRSKENSWRSSEESWKATRDLSTNRLMTGNLSLSFHFLSSSCHGYLFHYISKLNAPYKKIEAVSLINVFFFSLVDSKPEELNTSVKNHLKSPEKTKKVEDVEEGEITSEEEPLDSRRKKDKKQKKKGDKRQRVISVSDEHSYTESANGLNGVKEVSTLGNILQLTSNLH